MSHYTSETFTANVFGSAVYSGGSGYGEATRQWTAGLAFSDQFAREWSWNLSGAYQVSRSVFVTDAVNLTTIYGTAGLSYKPWEWASLDLTGNLNRQTSDGQFGDTLNNYSATSRYIRSGSLTRSIRGESCHCAPIWNRVNSWTSSGGGNG